MLKTALAITACLATSGVAYAQQAPTGQAATQARPAVTTTPERPTVASSIKDLLANPSTAVVVEKHLPGMSRHPALPQFQDMTLGQVAPMSGGMVTPATIAAIDTDLKALARR